ncbi:MAG TPA: TolC family protein [bacterium]|nr:TolC family protein [bacterium]
MNGLGALESLYRFEKSNFFPNLGAMGNYRIDYTSSVDDRGYPLPSSPYNGYGGEAGVGLEFNLNILEQVAKMRKARSEWKAKEYQASFMIEATLLDLRRKYDELRALDSQVEHLRKAHKMAKGWMTAEFLNYESGMLSTRDLIDAVKAFVEQEYALVNAMYEYNMKVEDLLTTAGFER